MPQRMENVAILGASLNVWPYLEGDLAPVLCHLHEGEQLHLPDVVRVLQPQAVHELPVLPVFTNPHFTRGFNVNHFLRCH